MMLLFCANKCPHHIIQNGKLLQAQTCTGWWAVLRQFPRIMTTRPVPNQVQRDFPRRPYLKDNTRYYAPLNLPARSFSNVTDPIHIMVHIPTSTLPSAIHIPGPIDWIRHTSWTITSAITMPTWNSRNLRQNRHSRYWLSLNLHGPSFRPTLRFSQAIPLLIGDLMVIPNMMC